MKLFYVYGHSSLSNTIFPVYLAIFHVSLKIELLNLGGKGIGFYSEGANVSQI